MKKMAKPFVWFFFILALGLLFFLIWAAMPQVASPGQGEGLPFEKSSGWNPDSLREIQNYLDQCQHVDAFVAIYRGREVFSFGDSDRLINLHSVRKPIISLLIGIAWDKGLIRLDETLGELGIREKGVELSEVEKTATVKDLLMARSGVYLAADAQPDMEKPAPQRGEFAPGEHYYYNNFDFNVLGTILRDKTGMSYEECLYQWLAQPLEMQEFGPRNVIYGTPFSRLNTLHPAYKTWMSARDLAKIGAMMAQKGRWKEKQIVSQAWLELSTQPYHIFSEGKKMWPRDAYAFLWALDTESNNVWGTGYGGQFLMVDTTHQLVLVQRHYTGNSWLSQGRYLMSNTQSSAGDLMQVWYALLRNLESRKQ